MPELPEVVTVVNDLKTKIINQKIIDLIIKENKLIKNASLLEFKNSCLNESIKNVFNCGKFIIFELDNDKFIVSHLRMSGGYNTSKIDRRPSKHEHIIFKLSNINLYYKDERKFGTFEIKNKLNLYSTPPLSKLGKYPKDLNYTDFSKKISKKSTAIKTVLLDQSIIVGLGNIYVNEVLFACKINPNRAAKDITEEEAKNILVSADKILAKAIELGGSSIQTYSSLDGKKGSYQNELKVHLRANMPCKKCKSSILKSFINQRGTYYCPKCQEK